MNNENVEQEAAMLPDGGGDGITPQEFSKRIKAKYPEYKDVDDVVLARKMVEKYPEYKNKVSFGTPDQPKKAPAVKSGASQSTSAAGGSLSALPRPKTTLIQRMQEDQMSRPKVGQEQAPVNQIDNRVKEDIRKDQKTWSSNKPVAQKVSQALKPAPETPTETAEPSYATNSVENYVDRHSKDYKYDHDYYKTVSNEELTKVTDTFDGTSILGISDRDFANYLKNKTNYFNSDIKYDSGAQEQFAINEYVNGYMADRANYLKDKFIISNPETRDKIIKESEVLGSQYEKYKKEVTPEYYKLEQDKKAKNREFYEDVKKGKNFLTDAESTSKNLIKGATFALGDLVSSAADLTGFDNYADKLRFEKKFIDWNEFDQGTVTYAKGKSVNYKGNDYIVTSTGNIVDKATKTSVNSFTDKSDMKNILTAAETSKKDDSVYSGRGYTYALANTVGNLAFQILATKGASGVAAKVGITEANVGRIAATAPEMVTVGGMVGSSTFNDTLEQLRKAGIPDDVAKGEASKVAAFTAAAGMIVTKFLPNTHANKILSSELNTPELIRQTVNIFRNEGSKGVSEFLKTGARDVILKSGSVAKEGFGEMIQELSENSAQKQGNYWTNAKLDKNILSTAWTKQEILDTAILSFAAGGGMGAIGKTRQGFLGTNVQENFDILSALDSSKLDEQGQTMIENGNLTRPEFETLKTQVQNYKAYKNKLTEDIKGKTAVEATQLMAERDKLKQDKKNLDEAFHPEIDAKIEALNGKINETLATKEDVEESAPEQPTQNQEEETKPLFNENLETPEGFTNRVHDSFVQLGSPSENSHVTEEGYTYRTVGDGEIQAIAETGGVFSREGKQKGGNSNTKYWTKGNGKNFYNNGKTNVIRVADANIDPNKVVSANDLEILTEKGFVPFSDYTKQQNNEQTATETNTQPETIAKGTEGETDQGKTENETKVEIISNESQQTNNNKTEDTGTNQEGENTSVEQILPAESSEETVNDFIDSPAKYRTPDGKTVEGIIKQDGQRVVVESGDRVFDVGNIDEIGNTPLSDYNISVAYKIETNPKGNITVRGKEYVNNYSDKKSAINYDENGKIQSVTLVTTDGQKRTFRGQIAEDIAYQIHSQDFTQQINDEVNLEDKNVFDRFIDNVDGLINMIDSHTKGTLGINILPAAAKGALKAIKASAIATKNTVQAIQAGIDYLKGTDWYKNLSKNEKSEFNGKTSAELFNSMLKASTKPEQLAEKRVEVITIPPTKKTKGIVRENTGQTDTSNKVSTTEAKLLKEKYKNLQRGYKQGVKETQQLKKEFVDYVKENIDRFSEHLTKNEVNRLLNMVGNINENNVDKVTNVIDNIVERLEGRADKAKLSSIAKLQQKANKKYKNVYGSNYVKIRNLTKIDPLFLPKSSVDTYHSLMMRLAKGEAVDISEVNTMAESLKDEINDYVDYKNQMKSVPKTENPEKRENAKNELTISSGAVKQAYRSGKFNSLNEGARGIVRQFLGIPSAYLETLTAPELAKITKALDYLGASGQLSNAVLSDVVSKYNARQNAKEIRGKVGDRVLKSVGTYTQKIAALLGKKNFSAKDFENGIANTMLQHVDTVVKGLKGTMLYDKLIHPITSNLTKASNQTAEVSKELTALFSKAVGKGNQFDTNAKLQMFFRQKEFEANPSLHGDKVFSLDEHIAETLKNKNNSKYDEDSLNAVEKVYKKVKGKSAEEMFDEMTPDEQKLVNKMEEVIKNIGVKSKNYNDHIVGETPVYLESFFPRRNDNYNKKGEADLLTFHSNGAPSITGNSSNDRTASKATPLNFNTIGNLLNYVKEANIESNLGQNLKEVRMTLSDLKNSDSESLVKLSNALEASVNNVVQYQLQAGTQNYDGKLDRVFNSLQRNTYKRVLVDFIKRLPVDIASNYIPVYMTYADRLPAMYKASNNMNPEVMTKMFENISSTQMDRLLHDGGAHSADYKSADSSNTSQYKYNKSNPSFGETFIDLMNHNKLGDFSEELNKLYYKLADKPAVHLWKLYMADEFKAVTGKEFNGEQYVNDAKYREDNNKVLQEIAKKADKMTSNLFNTSSTAERKLKVQAGNKDFLVRMNNFLRSFTNNEFKVFWDSLKGTTGIGETSFDSRAEAARAFAIVNTRGIMYSYLGSILGEILVNFAADDDDEINLINKKALEKSIAQHGMLITLGNSSSMTNLTAAFAIELLNRNIVESKGEKYSPYEDSYLYTPNEKSKIQDALNYLGAEGNATRVLYDTGEASYKVIKKYSENKEITQKDLIDLKAAQISGSFIAQSTGLPTEYLGKLSQKALKKKFSGDTDKKKWKGFGSFGKGGFGSFK